MEWRFWLALLVVALGMLPGAARGQAGLSPKLQELDGRIREVAQLPGEPAVFESAGVSRQDMPLRSIESREPIDGPKRRLILVGGLDGDDRGVTAVLAAVRWFKTQAPAAVRQNWTLIALPCGNPEGWLQFKPTN